MACHCSGLGYAPSPKPGRLPRTAAHGKYSELVTAAENGEVATIEQWCDALAEIPLLFQPGARHQYGYSHDVLGRVLEVVCRHSIQTQKVS